MQLAVYGFRQPRRIIEEAGIAYELNIILDKLTLGKPTEPVLKNYHRPDSVSKNEESVEEVDESHFDHDDGTYRKYLESLCPKEWKEQDHYRVLGLSKLRYRATPGQIKTACRFTLVLTIYSWEFQIGKRCFDIIPTKENIKKN